MGRKGRNGNGEGSIFKLADGTWRGFITLGYDLRGKQVKKWRRGKTRRQVSEKLNKIAAESGSRLVSRPEKVTVEEWLKRHAELRGREVRPRTRENYKHYLSKILPALGHLELRKLTPLQVRTFYSKMTDAGLSPSVRQHIHHFLKSGMKDALRMELIERNPLEVIDAPKGGRVVQPRVWEPEQVSAFLKVAQGERFYGAFYLMITLGLRIGEVLALHWSDLEEDRLSISRTLVVVGNKAELGPPKTERSYRTVYLSQDVLKVLEQRREEQVIERSITHSWKPNDLIFCSTVGTPVNTHNFRRTYRRLVERAEVPMIRVHDLRHTYITLARDAGIDAEVVANRVGQDVRVTMQIYSKVTESRKRKAARSLEALLHGTI